MNIKRFREPAWRAIADLRRGDASTAVAYLKADGEVSANLKSALAAFLEGRYRGEAGRPTRSATADELALLSWLYWMQRDRATPRRERDALLQSAAHLFNVSLSGLKARMKIAVDRSIERGFAASQARKRKPRAN
jgi:hypothetical protein